MSNFLDILKQEPKVAVVETKSVKTSVRSDAWYRTKHAKSTKYDGLSIQEWSEKLGVGKGGIHERIRLYGHPNPAELKSNNKKKHYEAYEGRTPREWAEHYGVDITQIYKRLQKNGTPHLNGVLEEPKPKQESAIIDGKTAVEWAKHYGTSPVGMRKRIARTGSPHPDASCRKRRKNG